MGLEEIVGRINEEAAEQAAKIVAGAKAEASKVVGDAKERADSIVAQARAQAERDVREGRLRSVASARLAAKRELLLAREDVLRRYEEAILESIDEFVGSKDYERFLLKAIEDGVGKIGKDAVIQVNGRDKALLKGNRLGGEVSKEPIESKGGALVSSEDGRRRVDNTIESIMRDRSDAIRLMLVDQVFGDGSKKTGP